MRILLSDFLPEGVVVSASDAELLYRVQVALDGKSPERGSGKHSDDNGTESDEFSDSVE